MYYTKPGFFFDKNLKTQGEKNSRRKKLKPNFGQKLNLPELLSPMWLQNSNYWKLKQHFFRIFGYSFFFHQRGRGISSLATHKIQGWFPKNPKLNEYFSKTQAFFSKLKDFSQNSRIFFQKLKDVGSKTQWTGAFGPSHSPKWSSKKKPDLRPLGS